MYTTLAKSRSSKGGIKPRSTRQGTSSSYGNTLSRSIQDQEPKSYEKTTVSFVSKFVDPGADKAKKAGNNSELFKHLKNAAMGGSGDIFRGGSGSVSGGLHTSASNRKQY